MKKYFLIIFLFLCACAVSRELYTDLQTGLTVYEAQCNGSTLTIGDCIKKAAEVCPYGFNPIISDKEYGGTITSLSGDNDFNSFNTWGVSTPIYHRNMIFTCKPFETTKIP